MAEGILMVLGVMILCAVVFSPLVLWDLYKKKKRKKLEAEMPEKIPTEQKTIIWWQALLCGLVIISFVLYWVLISQLSLTLPAVIVYPYYALVAWSVYFVAKKKIVFKKQ